MQEHTAIPFPLPQLTAADPLTELLRQGAQRLLAQAIEAEIAVLLAQYVDRHDAQGRTSRTPAMALGLTDHVWSYGEYIWLPVHTDPVLSKQMDERITRLLTPALQGQSLERTHAPTHTETLEEHEKEAAPLPKAA